MDLAGLDLTPEMEERYRNHKVVAFPSSRSRSTVREIAAATNSTQQQAPRRPRSLSAGRSRQRQNDLVQDTYDRMLSYGRLPSGAAAASHDGADSLPSPLRIASGGGSIEAQATFSELEVNFQERYRNAVSKSRGGVNTQAGPLCEPEHVPEDSTRRSGSVSVGRQMYKRWPPEATFDINPLSDDHTNNLRATHSPAPTMPAASRPPFSPKRRSQPGPAITHKVPQTVASSPSDTSHSCIELSSTNAGNSQTSSLACSGEEKKEEYEEAHSSRPASLKDRICAYGKPGYAMKPKSGVVRRSIDPAYAAQFAARDFPPKVDIYAETKNSPEPIAGVMTQTEKDDLIIETSDSNNQMLAPLNTASTQESSAIGPTDATDTHDQQHPPQARPQQVSPARKSFGAGRSNTKGNLANTFLAAINNNKPHSSSNNTATLPGSVTSKALTPCSVSGVPVVEINVSDSGDLGGNDINSVTGLSTVSGEEFSAGPSRARASHLPANDATYRKAASWQRAPSFVNNAYNYQKAAPPKPIMNNMSAFSSHNCVVSGPTSQTGTTSGITEMERMVEEQVQARVADVEARIEHKLRALVGQMEDKIMHRLDLLEMKMTAAVTKKK